MNAKKKSLLEETLADAEKIRTDLQKNASHVLGSTLKEDLQEIIKTGMLKKESLTEDLNPEDVVGDEVPTDLGSEVGDNEGMPSDDDLDSDDVIDLTDKTDDEVVQTFDLMEPADEIEIVKSDDGITIKIKSGDKEDEEPEEFGDEEPEEFGGEEPEDGEELPVPTDDEEPLAEGDVDEHNIPQDPSPMSKPGGHEVKDVEVKGQKAPERAQPVVGEHNETQDPSPMSKPGGHETKPVEEKGQTAPERKDPIVSEEEATDEETVDEINMKAKVLNHMTVGHNELKESLIQTRKKMNKLVYENKKQKDALENANKLVAEMKSNKGEYEKVIQTLKAQLLEVSLFTSNLTYAVKLISENTTTKDEKFEILKRLDSAKTLNESQEIYNALKAKFDGAKTSKKTIDERVITGPEGKGSSELNESTVYQNPQLNRMKDLISKIQK
jgi:hypothetical protein